MDTSGADVDTLLELGFQVTGSAALVPSAAYNKPRVPYGPYVYHVYHMCLSPFETCDHHSSVHVRPPPKLCAHSPTQALTAHVLKHFLSPDTYHLTTNNIGIF